jgi:hypothetical protein
MKKIIAILMFLMLTGCSSIKGTLKDRRERLKEYEEISIVAKTNTEQTLDLNITKKVLKINNEAIKITGLEVRFVNPKTEEVIFWDGDKFYKKTVSGIIKEITEPDVTSFVIFGIKIK